MNVIIQYQVLNPDNTAFGTLISSGNQPDKAAALAIIGTELQNRLTNSQNSTAKHQTALDDFNT
jgi:hypothetical protein